MVTLTIHGEWATYNADTKKVDTRLDKFVVELMNDESWKAPTGFNVSVVSIK
jgi:hypothetical protein